MSQTANLRQAASFIGRCLFLVVVALGLIGCGSINRMERLPHYGARLPGTIQVTVLQGFKHPGHYHLAQGATLGQLLDLAELKPFKWGTDNPAYWQYIEVNLPETENGRQRIGRDGHGGLRISAKARNLQLQDGQQVRCWCVTF
jgi:hypothetical protein